MQGDKNNSNSTENSKEELLEALLTKEAEIECLEHNLDVAKTRADHSEVMALELLSEVKKDEEQIAKLRVEVDNDESQIKTLERAVKQEVVAIHNLEHEIEIDEKRINSLRHEVKIDEEIIHKLEHEIEEEEEQINELKQEIEHDEEKIRRLKRRKAISSIGVMIVFMASVMMLVSLFTPVYRVERSSMSPTLNEGETIMVLTMGKIENEDVIAFYYGNSVLIKRVIAVGGQTVYFSEDGNFMVDGVVIDEPYADGIGAGGGLIDAEFPLKVPDGHYFVVGDNRVESIDSRSKKFGLVNDEDVIGKAALRVLPIGAFGRVS
ncbi:MAG: signal peptidase I [Oscillospiraceae bacterium]|nr:signal peptidase I [Oscillospiraceae bacterium]